MSQVLPPYDNEIDLIELFETIWRGKWLISAFVAISVISAFLYLQLAQPRFTVSVPYSIKLYSVSNLQLCGVNGVNCIIRESTKQFMEDLDRNWNFKNSKLVLSTETPLNVKTYDDMFDKINQKFTNEIYKEALDEITFIKNEINVTLLKTDRDAYNMLNGWRIMKEIDSGQKALYFGSVAIKKISPNVPLILALSIVLSGMIGLVFVFFNNTIRKRKDSASKV